jgi:hypothetical protein
MRNHAKQFFSSGWCRFASDPLLLGWIRSALAPARAARQNPEQAKWLRYQGTWFAGVNALANDVNGAVGDSAPLRGQAVDFIGAGLGLANFDWDRAQVSICYPGYPQPMAGESPARTRYRREFDAAHVDGVLREGPGQRRHLREHHGFILGIPMVEFDAAAAPFVVWEGSHEIMRASFRDCFSGMAPERWGECDITEIYHAARERAFGSCKRVEIHARPGEAYLVHRLSLHGMAPWGDAARAGPDGRMICYFRPTTFGPLRWLNDP